ncbi:unnamed protein product [Protopolystoma xenopodis]|uniref:Phenylalanyl tRNA synthetase beta chain core domain-containing protein n=1 Tax=Protopolystoma xenopodis TaxID=117903 RepID=A0A448XED3_9PLAT|nr:unnamed protein product [Protopolystoma xenopodis]
MNLVSFLSRTHLMLSFTFHYLQYDAVYQDVGAVNCRQVCAVYYNKSSGFEIIHGLLDRLMQVLEVYPSADLVKDKKSIGASAISLERTVYFLEPTQDVSFFEGRCARILLCRQTENSDLSSLPTKPAPLVVGHFGVLHPEVLRNFDLYLPCSALELNLEDFL